MEEDFARGLAKILRAEAENIEAGGQPRFPPPDQWQGDNYQVVWNVFGNAVDGPEFSISIRVTRDGYSKTTRLV